MRISTGMIYDSGVSSMQKRTQSLLHTQEQVSSGRRMLTPSEDPVAAAQALVVEQSQAANDSQRTSRDAAKNLLGLAESQLQSATDLLNRIHTLAVQGGGAALSAADRKSVAGELRLRFDELLGIANATDGTGLSMFGGYQSGNKPFAGSVDNGVIYTGDAGQQALHVGMGRDLTVATSGQQIFMNVKEGNGTFTTGIQSGKSVNAHTATITAATVTDAAAWDDPVNSGNLQVKFWVDTSGALSVPGEPGAVYYDLVDASTGNTLLAPTGPAAAGASAYMRRFQDGATLDFSALDPAYANPAAGGAATLGANVVVNGVPANGDTFTITRPSAGNIATAATSVGALHAGATIDVGLMTDPARWPPTGSGPNLQLKFWVDNTGGVQTPGYTQGAAPPAFPYTLDYGANEQFDLTVDGIGPATATLAGGPFATPADLVAGVQEAIDSSPLGPGVATVSIDAANHLVVTSTTIGAGASVDLTETMGNEGGLTALFGPVPQATPGITSTPGTVFYDLIDADTGNSAFTGTPTTTGVGGTYTHTYTSGAAIPLANSLPPTFDFGASVTVSGTPGNGDTFTVKASTDLVSGNGYFVTDDLKTAAANMGAGVVSVGNVLDQAKWNSAANSRQLEVRFWKDSSNSSGKLYYDLVDATTQKSLLTDTISTAGGAANTYRREFKSGDSIPFSGLNAAYGDFGVAVSITGTPVSGDVFTVDRSQSSSMFDNIAGLIKALEGSPAPAGASSGNAQLHNSLAAVLSQLAQSEDNISVARAVIGSNLSEIDSLDSIGESLNVQYSQTLSTLQDLDYAKAITDLTRQQTELQAAQKSFQMVSQVSLFNYM